MKLLICTQAVDLDDPVLGFMHRILAEFSKQCESVHVICLKEGRHALPSNVHIHSLGKESGRSRFKYVVRFYAYIWRYRKQYDAVYVHMNSEYVLLGALPWRMWKKKIALWFIHPKKPWQLYCATRLAQFVCTANEGSMRVRTNKKRVLWHGIDTDFFSPSQNLPDPRSILFLGRMDPVKRVEEFIRALDILHAQQTSFVGTMIGDTSDPGSVYAHDIRNHAAPLVLEGVLSMKPGVPNDIARDVFRANAIYCNLTPTGSFDKTTLEAMACGSVCVVANDGLTGVVDEPFMTDASPQRTAIALKRALDLSPEQRAKVSATNRKYVEEHHSLRKLVTAILALLSA